jgi:hypothetical protein
MSVALARTGLPVTDAIAAASMELSCPHLLSQWTRSKSGQRDYSFAWNAEAPPSHHPHRAMLASEPYETLAEYAVS